MRVLLPLLSARLRGRKNGEEERVDGEVRGLSESRIARISQKGMAGGLRGDRSDRGRCCLLG